MRRMLRWGAFGLLGAAVVANLTSPPPPRVDPGAWRALVIHSDDWGLEGWFPSGVSDSLRAVLVADVPGWQRAYLHSTLETGAEVRELAELLASFTDLDSLPMVLQANTIVAGPSVRAEGPGPDWPVHPSGTGPDYPRPDRADAVDAAIARGVWWPELHGLTHYDLREYARARAGGDPLARAAAREGVFAYRGYRRDSELGHPDAARSRRVIGEAVRRFRLRFGRRPSSVIAPDYRWTEEDERVWAELGIGVVQAKREQADPTLGPHTRAGRLRKWIRRQWFALRSPLVAVERTVDLEPYGDPDPAAPQGAGAAAAAIEEAFARGEPGVVSIHRVQLVSRRPEIAAAGRAQLGELVRRLEAHGGVRFLVDDELRQLTARGWSIHHRGGRSILRNWTDAPVSVPLGDGRHRILPPGTSAVVDKREPVGMESRN